MHGALLRNLYQTLLLIDREVAFEADDPVDSIESSFLCLAVGVILCPDLRVRKLHAHPFERPLLSARVHRHGDGCARAQRGQGTLVRIRAEGVLDPRDPRGRKVSQGGAISWTEGAEPGEGSALSR